jgi:hypothetical protein
MLTLRSALVMQRSQALTDGWLSMCVVLAADDSRHYKEAHVVGFRPAAGWQCSRC